MPDDGEIVESVEAISWLLKDDGKIKNVGDSSERLTPEVTLKLVQDLYAAGAVEVTAHDYEIDDWETADYLTVVLPEDAGMRQALFNTQEQIYKETHSPFDSEEEQGQSSFAVSW